jgi:pimeloyl-ACP methyl ester carboxylesterase
VRLRLFHAPDGARVAYREEGTGPPLVLLHSALLSHREFAPIVGELSHRFRVVLPDLPLHGDSEDRPRHPYTFDWLADVMAAFCRDAGGHRPLVAGHDLGAEILLHAVATGRLQPGRLVLMPNRMHAARAYGPLVRRWRPLARAGAVPGLGRAIARAAPHVVRPSLGPRLSVSGGPEAHDLVRHAFADVPGNPNIVRSWAGSRGAGRATRAASCSTPTPTIDAPVCCCGPTPTRCTRCAPPRRRSTSSRTRSCACSAGTGLPHRLRRPRRRRARADGLLRLGPTG